MRTKSSPQRDKIKLQLRKKYPTFFNKDGSLRKKTKKQHAEISRLVAKLQSGCTLSHLEYEFLQMFEARDDYENYEASKCLGVVLDALPESDTALLNLGPSTFYAKVGEEVQKGDAVVLEENTIRKCTPKEVPTADKVNHPSHYNSGKIEVIEAIEDWKLGYHLGNTVKYVARAGKKDPTKTIEDLEKALWYLNRKILKLKAEEKGIALAKPNNTSIQR